MKASKQQYIKTKFLEDEQEETQLIEEILQEVKVLRNKIFLGFNIQGSDLRMLRNRAKYFGIYSEVEQVKIFDFRKNLIPGKKRGLSGLFEYLEIKVNQKIDGSYFRSNPKKVFARKRNYQDLLVTMFDYCLRDASGYFEIVSKWDNKFPLVRKDAIIKDFLYYSVNDDKKADGY